MGKAHDTLSLTGSLGIAVVLVEGRLRRPSNNTTENPRDPT